MGYLREINEIGRETQQLINESFKLRLDYMELLKVTKSWIRDLKEAIESYEREQENAIIREKLEKQAQEEQELREAR